MTGCGGTLLQSQHLRDRHRTTRSSCLPSAVQSLRPAWAQETIAQGQNKQAKQLRCLTYMNAMINTWVHIKYFPFRWGDHCTRSDSTKGFKYWIMWALEGQENWLVRKRRECFSTSQWVSLSSLRITTSSELASRLSTS